MTSMLPKTTLVSLMPGLNATLDIYVDAEDKMSLDEGGFQDFSNRNCFHNGGYLEPQTGHVWIPVYKQHETPQHKLWLKMDGQTTPPTIQLIRPPIERPDVPPCYAYVPCTGAYFLHQFIQTMDGRNKKKLAKMEEEDRLWWYRNYLTCYEEMIGKMFVAMTLLQGETDCFELTFPDGSHLYLSAQGASLENPQIWTPQNSKKLIITKAPTIADMQPEGCA